MDFYNLLGNIRFNNFDAGVIEWIQNQAGYDAGLILVHKSKIQRSSFRENDLLHSQKDCVWLF